MFFFILCSFFFGHLNDIWEFQKKVDKEYHVQQSLNFGKFLFYFMNNMLVCLLHKKIVTSLKYYGASLSIKVLSLFIQLLIPPFLVVYSFRAEKVKSPTFVIFFAHAPIIITLDPEVVKVSNQYPKGLVHNILRTRDVSKGTIGSKLSGI